MCGLAFFNPSLIWCESSITYTSFLRSILNTVTMWSHTLLSLVSFPLLQLVFILHSFPFIPFFPLVRHTNILLFTPSTYEFFRSGAECNPKRSFPPTWSGVPVWLWVVFTSSRSLKQPTGAWNVHLGAVWSLIPYLTSGETWEIWDLLL